MRGDYSLCVIRTPVRDPPTQDLRGDLFEEPDQVMTLLGQDRPQSVAFPARFDLWVSLRVGQGRLDCDGPDPFAGQAALSILHHDSPSLASPEDQLQDQEYPEIAPTTRRTPTISCDHPEKGGRRWPVLLALPLRIRRRGR